MGAEPLHLDVLVTSFKRMLDCEILSVCQSIVLDVLKSEHSLIFVDTRSKYWRTPWQVSTGGFRYTVTPEGKVQVQKGKYSVPQKARCRVRKAELYSPLRPRKARCRVRQ